MGNERRHSDHAGDTLPGPPVATRFAVGQLVRHQRFGYRGVVVDVDASFQLSDAWYEEMARSRPPRDAPWYHVLVHDAEHATYVAERNLAADASSEPIHHPLLERFFSHFSEGCYRRPRAMH